MAKEAAKKKEEEKDEKEEKKDDKKAKKEKKDDAKEGEEGAAEGAEGEGGAPKKSKKKLIIIVAAALVLIGGGVAGAYFAGLFGGQEEKAEEGAVGEDGELIAKPVYYTLPDFLINLNATGKQTSFLKTTVILVLAKDADSQAIEAALPKLQDAFNTYLRELRASDLAGSAGIQRLREELLLRANKSVAPVKINDVLFKEIVVQ